MAENDGRVSRTIKLPNGKEQTYEAANEQELLDKIFHAHQESVNALKDRERQIFDKNREIENLRSKPAPAPQPAPKQNGEFNSQTYWQLWAQDPTQATEYEFRTKWGMTPKEMADAIKQTASLKDQVEQTNATAEFHKMHPEYPATEEAAELMSDRLMKFKSEGLPINANTLDLAFTQLVREGQIQVEQKTEEEPPPSRGTQAPPSSTPSSTTEEPSVDWESMSTEEFEKKLVELGMK